MYHRISKLMTGLLFALLITPLWFAPASAQSNPGQWMTVDNDEPYWFSFRVGAIENGDSQSYVTIGLDSKPAGGAAFQVFGGGDWNMWDSYDDSGWIGEGYGEDNNPRRWAGELVKGTYFIRVEPQGAHEVQLAVNGEAVYRFQSMNHSLTADFIVEVEQPEVTPTPQVVAEPLPQTTTAVAVSPTVAEPQPVAAIESEMELVPGRWLEVDVDEPVWFTFTVGQLPEQNSSRVSISLFTEPGRSGEFQIFDGANVNVWATPEQGDWFGEGTSIDSGPYTWAGNLVPGSYFVRLDPENARNLLAVSGEAVQY